MQELHLMQRFAAMCNRRTRYYPVLLRCPQ